MKEVVADLAVRVVNNIMNNNLKNAWINTYTGKKFYPLNPNPNDIDIEDIAHSLSNLCRFTGHSKDFYCVTPDTKILTSDLIWKPAGDLKTFEGLVGFDENTGEDGTKGNNRKKRRKMKQSNVLHTGIIYRNVFALHLSDGTILKSSAEHPWLVSSKISRNQKWETTSEIIKAISDGKQRFLLKFFKPWDNRNIDPYKIGYLAGIYDGEGTISCNRRGFQISVAQNEGIVLEKIKSILNELAIDYGESINKYSGTHNLQLKGSVYDRLKFLGTISPNRLLNKYKNHLRSGEWRKEFDSIELCSIVKVENLGRKQVVALETSSKTYFAEGFGSHNSVAQHSVLVSLNCDKEDALIGLCHDQSEAFLNDVSSPLKRTLGFEYYRSVENVLQTMMYKKFCNTTEEPKSVKIADLRMLATEARDLMPNLHPDWKLDFEPYDFKIIPLPPKEAKELFLARFKELTSK